MADAAVADLAMEFLHDGRPKVVREAVYTPPRRAAAGELASAQRLASDYTADRCCEILGSLNVASKEWVIRQYDHEVQGGSVVKPLVGVANDGPERRGGGAAGVGSRRGIVIPAA